MIQEHKLDLEKSREVYKKYSSVIKIKECYNNIFNILSIMGSQFSKNGWKIAYGYFTVHANLMARHCFIIDQDNNVIDPTRLVQSTFNEEETHDYISFKVFDDITEYLHAISENDNNPDLVMHLLKNEQEAHKWSHNKTFVLIG